jgi:ABC-2 type transport system permease protein
MKRFFGFVRKEFYHIFRDKRSLLIIFGMPIVQIMLFGYAITNEIKDANIAILDFSKDATTKKLTDKILSSGYFRLYAYLNNDDDIEKIFRKGEIKQAIIFEKDFDKNLSVKGSASVQIISDASDPNTGNTLINYTSSIIYNYINGINVDSKVPFFINIQSRLRYNPELKSAYLFVPGLIAFILMLVSAMMTSISITREKELGTMEILLVSPVKPSHVIIAKVLPYSVLAFINAMSVLMLGKFVFGVPMLGSYALLLSECILYIITALSFGIFISTITSSQQVALMVSLVGIMLPTILLSGYIYPIENMPLPLQIISVILPARWFLIILKDIMIKGSGIEYLWKETLIIIGMTGLFIGLSIKNYKVRL